MFAVKEVQLGPLNRLRKEIKELNKELAAINHEMARQSFLYVMSMLYPLPMYYLDAVMLSERILRDREIVIKSDISKLTTLLGEHEKRRADVFDIVIADTAVVPK